MTRKITKKEYMSSGKTLNFLPGGVASCPGRGAAFKGDAEHRRSCRPAETGPRFRIPLHRDPGSAAHRHSASKTRVNALMARATRCAASGERHADAAAVRKATGHRLKISFQPMKGKGESVICQLWCT